MVLPFNAVSCSNTSSCRDKANAEPDFAFEQGGLSLVWRHCCPSGVPGKSPFLMYVCPGGHSLECVVAEQDNCLFMTECFVP